MITTKDLWFALSKEDKTQKVKDCLEQLHNIANNKHELSDKPDQGRLAGVKRDLEEFLINTAEWESNKQLQKQHSR